MKKILLSLMLVSFCTPVLAWGNYVRGYSRSDGTYVQPHYQSNSNYTQYDNYSTRGNYNPYTGQAGTVNVDTPSHNYGYNYGYSRRSNSY